MDELKKCSKCQDFKKLNEFRNCKKSKDGKMYFCRSCHDEVNKKRYLEQKDHIIKMEKNWQLQNKVKYLEYQKAYRQKQKELKTKNNETNKNKL